MSEQLLYDVLVEAYNKEFADFNNAPKHRFSHSHKVKMRRLFAGDTAAPTTRPRIKLKYVWIAIILACVLVLAGFTIYITHYIGNMQINEYDTHSFAFSVDVDNSPQILESRYEITYDLSDWKKTVVEDIDILYFETYRNNDKGINFSYSVKSSYQGVRFNTEGSTIETKSLEDKTATFYISPTGVECLIWDNGDCIMEFFYTGITYDQALEIISTIKKH